VKFVAVIHKTIYAIYIGIIQSTETVAITGSFTLERSVAQQSFIIALCIVATLQLAANSCTGAVLQSLPRSASLRSSLNEPLFKK